MEDLLAFLNSAQRLAVTHKDGPLLIVAGAGTGKTTVLTRRYAHVVKEAGCSTEQLLALTFTEKAAGEMEDRVLQLLPTGTYDFWISTFHGFCERVLEAHGLEIGLPHEFRILTPTDAWLLLKRHLAELPLDYYRPMGHPVKFLRALIQHLSRAKDEGITPEAYLAFAQNAVLDGDSPEIVGGERKRLQELANLYFAYRKILLDEGCLDFGDLILETLRLFRERPAALAEYQAQFRYLMVDEFQDTNWAQYELLKLLAGDKRNLTVVGDDDQSIYKFRGASLANILQFKDDFPDAKTVALTENYRSHAEILDTAYRFIKKNDPHRLEVKLKGEGLSKALTAMRGTGGLVNVIWRSSVEDEAEAVIKRIKELKKGDTSWNEFAILVRANDGAEPFVRACETHGIPFQFMALRGLYAKPAVLDLFALLSLIDGYHESASVWRALHMPCYPFPARDVAEITHYANRKGLPLWFAVTQAAHGWLIEGGSLSDEGKRIAGRLVHHIEALTESARREPPLRIVQFALEKTEYIKTILRLPEREKQESLRFLNGFADRIKRYEARTHGPTLRGLLEELRLEMESGEEGALQQDADAGPEMVKIMTVHAAKGLEFKHVFAVSLVDQRFPTRPRPEAIPLPDGLVQERLPEGDAHIEEERRLFYVAMTRAKDSLTLSGAAEYGGARAKKPSLFFAEAGCEPILSDQGYADESRRLHPVDRTEDQMDQTFVHYQLKKKFSFTQLAAFRKCPLQYKFEHIYKIPKFGTYNKSFGQSIHLTYQQILERHLARVRAVQGSLFGGVSDADLSIPSKGLRVSTDEALQISDACWIDEWYNSRREHDLFKEKGKRAIRNFCEAYRETAPEVMAVEQSFTLVLGPHSLKGKIDRIDTLSDGTVAIVDYKTGEAKEELTSEDKEQLHLYQIALEEKGLNVSRLSYVYVVDWGALSVEPLAGRAREAFLEKIFERMEAITRSRFHPTPEPFTCKFCDFRSICEFRKLS